MSWNRTFKTCIIIALWLLEPAAQVKWHRKTLMSLSSNHKMSSLPGKTKQNKTFLGSPGKEPLTVVFIRRTASGAHLPVRVAAGAGMKGDGKEAFHRLLSRVAHSS